MRQTARVVVWHATSQTLLALKRDANAPLYPNTWVVPGGRFDTEQPEDAARRELYEETGITAEHLDFLGTCSILVHEHNKEITIPQHFFRLVVDTKQEPALTEETEYAWMTINEFIDSDIIPEHRMFMQEHRGQIVSADAIARFRVAKAFLCARDTGRFCFEVRARNDPLEGRIALPGGGIDEDETPTEAMQRELFEELGTIVHPTAFDKQEYTVTHDNGSRAIVMLHYFIAEIENEHDVTVGSECEAIEWHSLDALPKERMIPENNEYIATHRARILQRLKR